MSEYQYYELVAVDRQLSKEEGQWRVAYSLLYRVLDGQGDQEGELLIDGERADQRRETVQGSLLE